ncbi:hypothetical protein HQ487_00285 [Candidatus Uhrbacteria bacterium]|nr:hypothetical protein [Candidatus Uhrbacteria bacterium]
MLDTGTLRLKFIALINRGSDGLDLGAGDGRWAFVASSKQARVTAIDRQPSPDSLPIGMRWIQADVCNGLSSFLESNHSGFDFMMCWNLIQFLPHDYVTDNLLPSLAQYARPNCVLGLRTFWRNPIPGFANPVPSLYRTNELVRSLKGWDIIHKEEIEGDGPSLDGTTMRHWYFTDIIARFPS